MSNPQKKKPNLFPHLTGVGEYWSQSNADFEATDPSLLQRAGRALNPMTGFGSALGAMHDGASKGSKTEMAVAAFQAVPVFGSVRAVAPTMKAAAHYVPSLGKTAAFTATGTGAGVAADEIQAQSFDDVGGGENTSYSEKLRKHVDE